MSQYKFVVQMAGIAFQRAVGNAPLFLVPKLYIASYLSLFR